MDASSIRRLVVLAALACGAGCNFESPGGGGNSGASLGGEDDDDGTGTPVATGSGSQATTAMGDTGGGSATPTTDPIEDTGGTPPTVTSPDTGDASDTTQGVASDPTAAATDTGNMSAEGGSTSTGETPPIDSYPACMGRPLSCAGGELCIALENQWDDLIATWCAPQGCDEHDDCPEANGGTATPLCVSVGSGSCSLDCSGGASCPAEMQCYEIWVSTGGGGGYYVDRCAWPS